MRIVLVFSLILMIPFLSCKSMKNLESKKIETVRLNILEVKKGSADEPWDLNVEFELINETNKDFYVPTPSDIYNYSFVTNPHFFGYELKGYECEHEVLFSDGTVKKIDAFMKIEAKSRKKIIIKPFNSLSVFCSAIQGEKRYIQVLYTPDQEQLTDEFVKSHYKNESELNKIIDIYNQIYKDTIVSPPFNLTFE